MPSAAPAAAPAAAAEEAPVEVRTTRHDITTLLTLCAGEAEGEDHIQHKVGVFRRCSEAQDYS